MLGVDLMGPLPKSKKGNVYLLVVVDYFTKWVELFPIRDGKTHRICKFLQEEVLTRWGVPKFLLSTLLLCRLARGEMAPRLSLVSPKVFFSVLSPMEFWFLAAVASGLLSWGHLISSNIVDLIEQKLFELN